MHGFEERMVSIDENRLSVFIRASVRNPLITNFDLQYFISIEQEI